MHLKIYILNFWKIPASAIAQQREEEEEHSG